MSLRDLLDLVSKEKRKRERAKATQRFAVGMGVVAAAGVATGILLAPKSGKEIREDLKKKAVETVETVEDTVRKQVETLKDSAAHTVKEVRNTLKDIHGKTEGVKKDIKDGYYEMKQDIYKTAENISSELNKSIK